MIIAIIDASRRVVINLLVKYLTRILIIYVRLRLETRTSFPKS